MLISLSKKFVFIANLKTASTSIEMALRRHAEIALVEARFGKHQFFSDVERRFEWALSLVGPPNVFVFGVMRDPVDYMISLYNSHTHPSFRDCPELYTGNMDFAEFLNVWAARNSDQTGLQYRRFLDNDNRLAVHYLISFERLHEGLKVVSDRLRLPGVLPLQVTNTSEARLHRSGLRDAQRVWIENRFWRDRQVMTAYCDRPLQNRQTLVLGKGRWD